MRRTSTGMSSRRWRSDGQLDLELRDAEVKVAPEGARVDLAHQIAAGGGDDAHVDGAVAVGADALDAPLGQRAQELGLHVDGQLAELVEEDGAAVGLHEGRDALVDGAGERAALVAEERALGQRGRDGAAVDDDEGLVRAGAGLVDGLGDELLAGARLARDEHGEVGGGGLLEALEHAAHARAVTDQGPEAGDLGDVDLARARWGRTRSSSRRGSRRSAW